MMIAEQIETKSAKAHLVLNQASPENRTIPFAASRLGSTAVITIRREPPVYPPYASTGLSLWWDIFALRNRTRGDPLHAALPNAYRGEGSVRIDASRTAAGVLLGDRRGRRDGDRRRRLDTAGWHHAGPAGAAAGDGGGGRPDAEPAVAVLQVPLHVRGTAEHFMAHRALGRAFVHIHVFIHRVPIPKRFTAEFARVRRLFDDHRV